MEITAVVGFLSFHFKSPTLLVSSSLPVASTSTRMQFRQILLFVPYCLRYFQRVNKQKKNNNDNKRLQRHHSSADSDCYASSVTTSEINFHSYDFRDCFSSERGRRRWNDEDDDCIEQSVEAIVGKVAVGGIRFPSALDFQRFSKLMSQYGRSGIKCALKCKYPYGFYLNICCMLKSLYFRVLNYTSIFFFKSSECIYFPYSC